MDDFRQVGMALDSAERLGIDELGVGAIAVASARLKRAASTKPAAKSFREETLPAKEVDASRWEYTATKAGAPHSEAVYCHLRVIEGGLATGGRRKPVARPSAATREGAGGRTVLKLVHAAPRSMID